MEKRQTIANYDHVDTILYGFIPNYPIGLQQINESIIQWNQIIY